MERLTIQMMIKMLDFRVSERDEREERKKPPDLTNEITKHFYIYKLE